MQLSWREDADKLTFIACRRDIGKSIKGPVDAGVDDAPDLMIGDVNLFLSEIEDEEDDNSTPNTNGLQPSVQLQKGPTDLVGEVELMIAVPEQQGKGYGRAVLQLFLCWVLDHRDKVVREKLALLEEPGELKKLRVKIHESNCRSLGLFESLGFRRTQDGSNYFGEVEMDVDLQKMADSHWEVGDWAETEYRQPPLYSDGG